MHSEILFGHTYTQRENHYTWREIRATGDPNAKQNKPDSDKCHMLTFICEFSI